MAGGPVKGHPVTQLTVVLHRRVLCNRLLCMLECVASDCHFCIKGDIPFVGHSGSQLVVLQCCHVKPLGGRQGVQNTTAVVNVTCMLFCDEGN